MSEGGGGGPGGGGGKRGETGVKEIGGRGEEEGGKN